MTLLPLTPPDTALTAEQRRIVERGDGPAVVIAGAGTGKTRVIVDRVKWLLENTPGLVPEQILVLTYERQGRTRARSTASSTPSAPRSGPG